MCWNCSDCEIVQKEPLAMICNGFSDSESKRIVVKNGHLTKDYRWCSKWTQEQINRKEAELLNLQAKLLNSQTV